MADNLRGSSRLGIPPEIRDILRYIENPDGATGLDVNGNLILKADSRFIAFGAEADTDSKIFWHATNGLSFYDAILGDTKTLTQLAAAAGTLDAAFDQGKIIDGADSAANAVQIGGSNDKILIYENANNDVQIGTTAGANLTITAAGGAISFGNENLTTTGTINIGVDSVNLTLGASGATDSYIQFNGSDLIFYSSALGGTVTLVQLAGSNLTGPTITGDLTISNGQIGWTDSVDERAGLFTFSNQANDGIQMICNAMTTGSGIRVDATEATLTTGYYFEAFATGGTTMFGVKKYGEIEITGNAGDDMITIAAGNLQLDNGKIEVDTTQDIISYVKRNNAASANPVVEIEQTHTGATGSALLIDQNATGAAKGLEITHDGDLASIDITAGAARTGNVINIVMASQLAETALDITGAATGTASEGIIHVDVTGALAGNPIRVDSTGANLATGQLLYLLSTGNQAAPTNGICAYFQDTGAAAATSYAVYISSTSNEALYVATGEVLFAEKLAVNDNVMVTVADTANVDALTVEQNDTTNNKDGIVATVAGTGKVLKCTVETAGGGGAHFIGAASQTTSLVTIDGATADWIGANGVGMLQLTGDGALAHANANLLRVAFSGNAAGANVLGNCAAFIDTGAASGTSYAVYISSTNNEGLNVATGKSVFAELVTCTSGVITKYAVTDTDNPPTQAQLVTAFGAANQGAGLLGVLNDAGGGAAEYICWSDGANWWYVAGTVGA